MFEAGFPPFLHTLQFKDVVTFDVATALVVYLVYHRYEVNPSRVLATVTLLGLVPAISAALFVPHFSASWLAIPSAFGLFYTVLVSSVVAYRLSPLHPLAKYPGPISLRISKFAIVFHAWNGKLHEYAKKLHDQYGDYVRIGPNELSVTDSNAIYPVLGTQGFPRGPLWDARVNSETGRNLLNLRDATEHARRRRPWVRAFTPASVKEYEPILTRRILQLADCLQKASVDGVVYLNEWISYFTFDFMGDLAFGGGFEIMREGDTNGYWRLLNDAVKNISMISYVPWFGQALVSFGLGSKTLQTYRDFTVERVLERKKRGSKTKDIFYHLIDEEGHEKSPPTIKQLASDGSIAIIAGADTASSVMTGFFYYVLTNPEVHKKILAELDATFPHAEGEPFDAIKLLNMKYLNACINETLRLQPPLSFSLQRAPAKGSGGKMIGSNFIPENTAINLPPYVLHRDPRYFSPAPDTFIPERWLEDQNDAGEKNEAKFHNNLDAYIPFSFGPANCVGRNLAMLEMRMVISTLLQRFDFSLAPGFDAHRYEESRHDWYALHVGELPVVIKPRVVS